MAQKEFNNVIVQHLYDTSENWTTNNPVLRGGELGIESDTSKIKVGNGTDHWNDLDYSGADDAQIQGLIDSNKGAMYSLDAVEGKTDLESIATVVPTPKKNDIAVVKHTISGDKKSYTGYVYNGTAWAAMDGNYSADNVYFDSDLTYTAAIGVKTVPASGSGTIAATGKNVKQVLADILAKEKTPATTQPTATLNSSNIGTKVAIAYSFTTSAGSYTYGPATGVTFSEFKATFNKQEVIGQTGAFDEIQVTDTTNLTITGSCKHTDGAVPKTNIGNNYAAGQIKAKTLTPSKGTLKGFRGWFYGYKNGTNAITAATITSAQVRALGSGAVTSIPAQISTSQMKQMFFAIPKGIKTSISVADATNGAPQTVTKITDVMVEGANGFTARAYDVWYVDNAAAASGNARFNITVK